MPSHPDEPDASESGWSASTHAMSSLGTALGPLDPTLAPPIRIRFPDPPTSALSLDRIFPGSSTTPAPGTPRAAKLPSVPGYEILGELGRGGMGVVYRARQVRLNRFVALKMLLHAETADLSDVIRFRSEAEAVAAVRHPHVVQVHEFGHSEGKPYFAMEYLSGGTLSNRIRALAPFDPPYAAALVEKLAHAVQAAHAQGIVHRDLKPGNILFDGDGEPRITDFGLAKRVSLQLTRTQAVMGTPAYMSPEQASGRTKFVGPPSDIYALGVILYECLTGKPPFAGEDSIAVLHRVMHDAPRSLRAQAKGVPRDLELICLKCLEKLPDDRYPTSGALADELARFSAGKPVEVRPAGPIERGVKWARRRPTMATVYALSALVLVVTGVGLGVAGLWQRAAHARDEAGGHLRTAELAKVEVETQRSEAEQARDRLAGRNGELEAARAEIAGALAREKVATADAVRSEKETQAAKRKVEDSKESLEELRYFRNVAFANLELRSGNVLQARKLLDDCTAARRDWEWWHAYRNAHDDVGSGSTNSVATDIAFVDRGRNVTTADDAGIITPFDFSTRVGQPKPLVPDTKPFYLTRLTEDASRLLTVRRSAAKDPDIATVWDTKTGKPLRVFPATGQGIRSASIAAGGERVLIGYNHPVHLAAYDVPTGKTLGQLDGYCPCEFTALNRDGSKAFVVRQIKRETGHAYELILWDTATGVVLAEHASKLGMPSSIALDAEATCAAIGYSTGELVFLDLRTEKTIAVEKAHTGAIHTIEFRRDGKKIVSSGEDGIVRVWDAQNGTVEHHLRGHTKRVLRARFDSTGQFIASTDAAQRFFIWDLKGAKRGFVQLAPPDTMKGQFVSDRSANRLFSYGDNGDPQLWDIKSNELRPRPAPAGSKYTAFAFDPSGTRFAGGTDRGAIQLWKSFGAAAEDLPRFGKTKLYLDIRADNPPVVETMVFSADGARLLVSDGWQLAVFDTETHAKVFSREFRHAVACIAEDGRTVAASWHRGATLWTVGAETTRTFTTGGPDWISSLAISPKGDRFAAGTRDWELYLFDLTRPADGKDPQTPTRKLAGHSAAIQCLAYHPKGHRLVSGAEDGTIKVWDTASGHEAISPTILVGESIRSLGFGAAGNELVAVAKNHAPYILHGGTREPVVPPRR